MNWGLYAAGVLLSGMGSAACTYSGGELLYLFGVGRGELVKAEFRLTDGAVLILVDDPAERVDWPAAARHLHDELSQELVKKKAAKKIIPLETLEQLRRAELNFEKRGCREVGKLAGAEQVLWVEVQDFLADEQIVDAHQAAYFAVTVKVINALEEENGGRVRLWPTSPAGRAVTVLMQASEVNLEKTKDAIARQLAKRLAVEIAELFYDHRLGDFERK